MFKNKFLKILFLLLIISGCKKDVTYIPNVVVDINLNINLYEYRSLNTDGGWVYITGGYKGIIVYRKYQDEFMAYDRACPYHPKDDCARIEVESAGLIAVDSCCGSQFLLSDGSVHKGPATPPLKSYRTILDGHYLRIFN